MDALRKKFSGRTAIKYFLSYLIIISVLILGFFFILKKQITDSYFEYRSEQAQIQLTNIAERFGDDLIYLSQVDASIVSDMELIQSRYRESYTILAMEELREYASTTQLIQSIVYMPKKSGTPLSTTLPVTYSEGVFHITDSAMNTVTFDPAPWLGSRSGQLIYLSGEKAQYLLYFPATNARANYIFFYILDTGNLQQQFKGLASEETLAIALVDGDSRIVLGVHSELLQPYLGAIGLGNGTHPQADAVSLCIRGGISQGFTLVSLLSRDFLSERINEAFASSYLALLLLSLVGFGLMILAMRITYLPLHRLTQRIVPNASNRQGYLNQLESAFTASEDQKQLLKSKLEDYRVSIQKSLLDTLVISQYPGTTSALDMDQLFDRSAHNRIFILHMKAQSEIFPWDDAQQFLVRSLPEGSACALLEPKQNGAVFLINFTGDSPDKDRQLKSLCQRLFEQRQYLCAISNGSESPLDIPVLYENAIYAASFWPRIPVAPFPELSLGTSSFAYPHESLEKLTELLADNNFNAVRLTVSGLFSLTDLCMAKKGNLTNFFVQCVLTDILTRLTNYMNLSYIKFTDYSDLYFKTLYLCRNGSYGEKAKEIQGNMARLIDFCEQSIAEKIITAGPLIRIMEENYCQPDFSIAALADKFHVSTAYMSQLFKREMNVNFSDYLWTVRQKKAQTLLQDTDLSIEDISLSVGYANTSSFRRKFKQETGITPSQYRDGQKAISEK